MSFCVELQTPLAPLLVASPSPKTLISSLDLPVISRRANASRSTPGRAKMSSGATYNVTRFTRQVLKRHRRAPPSLVIHLYPTHFRFEHQHGNFAYDSPMKCFLEAVREQKLPTDLLEVLDESGVVYYDGAFSFAACTGT